MAKRSTYGFSKEQQGIYAVHVVNRETDINYVYIGSGRLSDRVTGNKSKLRRNKHENKQLQSAYNDLQNCFVEILDDKCISKEHARKEENKWVDYFKRIDGVVVCNVDPAVITKKEYKIHLNEEKAREIKELLKEGKLKQYEIAAMYGVNPAEISKINTGLRFPNA